MAVEMIVCLHINCYVRRKENVMPIKVTQEIGTLTVEVTGEEPKDIIRQLAFFGTLPAACPYDLEGAPCNYALQLTFKTVVPQHGEHKGKTLKYYGLRCANTPAHECNFGQRADDGSIFYKGASSFQVEYKAREGAQDYHGDHEDHGRQQQQSAPRQEPRDDFNETAAGVAPTQQSEHGNGGPTSGQRTLMSKLLADMGLTLEQAYTATGASKKWEEMNAGQAARFIDAVKNIKKEVAF
jgi:hypothetical protein